MVKIDVNMPEDFEAKLKAKEAEIARLRVQLADETLMTDREVLTEARRLRRAVGAASGAVRRMYRGGRWPNR